MIRTSPFILAFALATSANAQAGDAFSLYNVKQHDIRSSVNHREYRLSVALPDRPANDTTRYPVLYVLDGEIAFPLVTAVRGYLQDGGAIPRVIIVGVGFSDSTNWNIRRRFELTPSSDPAQDAVERRVWLRPGDSTTALPSGGAPDFLETVRRDIIPFIDRQYRTSTDRGLLGHSFGGLFAVYAFHTAPELFNRYGIFSPSTWWKGGEILGQLAKTNAARAPTGTRIFVSAGTDEYAEMRAEADSVASILTRVHGARLTLAAPRFPGRHASYFPEAVSVGLAFLYPNPSACEGTPPTLADRRYVFLNGRDTIATERFVRGASEISGEVRQQGTCVRYQMTLDLAGKTGATHLVEQRLSAQPRTITAAIHGSRIDLNVSEPAQEKSFEASGRTGLYVPIIVASVEQLIGETRLQVGDSTRVLTLNFRHGDTTTTVIVRTAAVTCFACPRQEC